VTVFFSSHVLSEVRRLCDRVGIIREGRLATIEPIDALLERTGKSVRIHADESIPLDALDVAGVHDLETAGRNGETTDAFTECTFTFTGDINTLLGRLGEYTLLDLSIEEAPLEDVFLQFYGER
jgi:ABC-2 type transport system ATP-binding protein